ncbi:MAG: hypothetical protein ABR517_03680 [Thermoanaerobaculia bacterium]
MSVLRPLPGISFETQAPPLRDILPRMDIPLFVGFAAAGPVDRPVPVQDDAQFRAIFGDDVSLPAPRGASEQRRAHLGPTVRAFFRNGGRRCWIVRVAGGGAVRNRFRIPGLFQATPAGALEPAFASARSVGSWSDALHVQTSLVAHRLQLRRYDHDRANVEIEVRSSREVSPGDVVRVQWSASPVSLFLFVERTTSVPTSPPAGAAGVVLLEGSAFWIASSDSSPVSSPLAATKWTQVPKPPSMTAGGSTADRLQFDLIVRRENSEPMRMLDLGFSPEHRRYFGALPSDETLFDSLERSHPATAPRDGWPELWKDAADPRFPLAFDADGSAFIPAGMTAMPSETARAEKVDGTALERDGLDGFGAELFIDPRLGGDGVRTLLGHADVLRYLAGERLTGIHAGLAIEEVTMLSVPDAVHPGWKPERPVPITSPLSSSPLSHPERWRWMDCREPLPPVLPEHSAGFISCDALASIDPPFLAASPVQGGTYTLTWEEVPDATVELQESTRNDFDDAATIALGDESSLTLYGRSHGDYFYRARRIRGARTSDWSAGLAVRVGRIAGWLEEDETSGAMLATVHAAMLRMCAARADLVAILSLPRTYDAARALAHATKLAADLEPQVLSYGSLWHPWLTGRDDDAGPLMTSPPDGAMAGVMAARAVRRGAWVAPANEPLRGVVALTPAIPVDARQALQDGAVNLIRRSPDGFLCLDADTLSGDAELRPLNVRRLLILVRRAALVAGNEYLFEPNGAALHNTIRRGFESMLAGMFQRGAFAGRTATSAYRVIVDETLNTSGSVDAGRVIAELRVAPSRPLAFLAIRLLQRGEAAAAEEVR